jgi:hypothetical protein
MVLPLFFLHHKKGDRAKSNKIKRKKEKDIDKGGDFLR